MAGPSNLMDLDPGDGASRTWGRYTVHRRIAEGGMASVYLARLQGAGSFQKWVALKVVHARFALDDDFVRMFLNEARLAARLSHPNICDVYDFGQAEGTYYLAMEFLRGEALNTVIRDARAASGRKHGLPPTLAGRIVADAARGLHAAHELRGADGRLAEVVHRDVSPQNIFVLDEGTSKVVDFGIARSNDRMGEATTSGVLKGKLSYMAPEQLQRKKLDRRADVFALGVVFWETLSGRRLFRRDSEADTILAILQQEIPAPGVHSPGVPDALARIAMRALERDPNDRYASAADMAREIEQYLASTGVPAGHPEVSEFMHATFAERIHARHAMLRQDAYAETPADDAAVELALPLVRQNVPTPASGVGASTQVGGVAWPLDPPLVHTDVSSRGLGVEVPSESRRRASRSRVALAGVGALALAGAVGGALWLRGESSPPSRSSAATTSAPARPTLPTAETTAPESPQPARPSVAQEAPVAPAPRAAPAFRAASAPAVRVTHPAPVRPAASTASLVAAPPAVSPMTPPPPTAAAPPTAAPPATATVVNTPRPPQRHPPAAGAPMTDYEDNQ